MTAIYGVTIPDSIMDELKCKYGDGLREGHMIAWLFEKELARGNLAEMASHLLQHISRDCNLTEPTMFPVRKDTTQDTYKGSGDVADLPCAIIDGVTYSIWKESSIQKRIDFLLNGEITLVIYCKPIPPVSIATGDILIKSTGENYDSQEDCQKEDREKENSKEKDNEEESS